MKDQYAGDAVNQEAPPREGVSAGQPGLDSAMVKAVTFPQSRVAKDQWEGAVERLNKIKLKGRRKS